MPRNCQAIAPHHPEIPKVSGGASDKPEEPSKDFTVKINNSPRPGPPSRRHPKAAPVRPPAVPPSSDPTALTGVRVSPLAAQVREIGTRLLQDSDSDIDVAKVAEVRRRLRRAGSDRSQQDCRRPARIAS
jgi:negative regulator of flagellin synthesis FlgM